MNLDLHGSYQRMIEESLAGAISADKEQSLREHLATCAPCQEYLSASDRVIAGLSGFSFELNPTLNASIMAALRLQAQRNRSAPPFPLRFTRLHNVQLKAWVAFAVALFMSLVGSALVYQLVRLLAVSVHFDPVQLQAGVLVFWLLPSFCAALCLLAAPGEKRGTV